MSEQTANLRDKVAQMVCMDLSGRTAIVTGASQGIGAAVAMGLASRGAKVVVNYLKSEKKAAGVVEDITSLGGKAIAVQTDVSDRAAVDRMISETLKTFGQIDILVNNAGDAIKRGPFVELSWDVWEQVLNLSLKGTVNCCQAVIPIFKAQKSGRIINMTSDLVLGGLANYTPYVAAKSAVTGLSKSLAMELRDGITVNTIAPGLIYTDLNARLGVREEEYEGLAALTPLGRLGGTEDVVGAVVYFASDAGAFINGQTIYVNGGIRVATP